MGLVKTIYNVLGGFYMDYNSTNPIISVHKLNKSFHFFLCFFPSPFSSISTLLCKYAQKNRVFTLGFWIYSVSVTFSLPFSVNNASNSSLEIFSFSRRRSAQRSNTSLCSKMMRFASA